MPTKLPKKKLAPKAEKVREPKVKKPQMGLVEFHKNLHHLKWSTSLDKEAYLRLFAYLSVLSYLAAASIALPAMGGFAFGSIILKLSLIIIIPVAAAYMLWLVWQSLKICASRVHSFGYYFWQYLILKVVIWIMMMGIFSAGDQLSLPLKLMGVVVISADLYILFNMLFVEGEKKPEYKYKDFFIGYPRTVLTTISIVIVLALTGMMYLQNILSLL